MNTYNANVFFPGSLGPVNREVILLDDYEELRRAVAEVLGQDPETWPSHGNTALAITASVALYKGLADGSGNAVLDND